MKIGIFTDCYAPQINGVVTSVMLLKDALEELGHEVVIVTVSHKQASNDETDVLRIRSIPFNKWKEFRVGVPLKPTLYHTIKSLKLDLIHTHTEFSIGILGRAMAHLLRIPLVHTYHTMYEDYTHYVASRARIQKIVKKMIIRSSRIYVKPATAIVAPTEKTKSALLRYRVVNPIYIIPTGIDLNQFKGASKEDGDALRQQLHLDPSQPVVLSLGRLSQEKSVDWIIRQMQALVVFNPQSHLVIVGDGPYRKTLEALSNQLGLDHHITFVGAVPFTQVPAYYKMAQVFVSASKTETQGLTILEAMASNVPVIVYDDTNIKDLVVHNHTGLLFNTEKALSQQLCQLIGSPDMAEYLAQKGMTHIQSFSKQHYGIKMLALYTDLIDAQESLII